MLQVDYDAKEKKYLAGWEQARKEEGHSSPKTLSHRNQRSNITCLNESTNASATMAIAIVARHHQEEWCQSIGTGHHRTLTRVHLPMIEQSEIKNSLTLSESPTSCEESFLLRQAVKAFLLGEYTVDTYCSDEDNKNTLMHRDLFTVQEWSMELDQMLWPKRRCTFPLLIREKSITNDLPL